MSTCNVITVNQIKVSDLVRYSSLTTKDFILTIESGSYNDLYSRRSTFGDIAKYIFTTTGSFTGSFSGSIKRATGKFTGSFSGSLKGFFTGSTRAKHTGSFSGSFRGKTTGSFSGSIYGFLLSKTAKLTGSFSGSLYGYRGNLISKNAKLTGSFSGSTHGNLISKNSKLTGSFSGSYFGSLISKNSKLTGSFSGSYFGSLISKNVRLTGSLSGSFKGLISGSTIYNQNRKIALYGTSSCAFSSSFAKITRFSYGNPSGSGEINFTPYWTDVNKLAKNDYIARSSSMTAVGGGWPATTGRTLLFRPLNVGKQGTFGSGLVGQHLIQFSSSTSTQPRVDMYDLGLQISHNYIRTAASFSVFYSGSYDVGLYSGFGKDGILRPTSEAKSGKYGFTTLVARQRLLGVGHFYQASNIAAQLHVHLSSSFGWPDHTIEGGGYASGYNPNKNVFLITSGSTFTKLMRVSGSGQMDVKGDIVAFSTFATSDERLKEKVTTIENALDKIESINPVEFYWKHNTKKDYGVIAQQIEQIYPEFVTENMEGYKVVKYNPLIALLIKSVQELKQEVSYLKSQIK